MNPTPQSQGPIPNNGSTALARAERDYDGLVMVVSPKEALRRIQELQAFVKEVMVPNVDYGTIPGTEKPTLLQPGAQKLEEIYGFAHVFEDAEKILDWNGGGGSGFFMFRKRCVLTSRRDERYIGDGFGSCNSRESRYAWRWVFDNELPAGLDKATLKSETKQSRKTGKPYTRYRLPNEDVASLVNTIEKMACKRALVHAIIGATRSAGIFTQDAEDLPEEVFGQADESRSWQREQAQDAAASKMAEEEKKAASLREKLEAASSEQELRAVMTEIGKASLSKAYLDALRELARKSLGAMRTAAEKAKKESEANDANEDFAAGGAA